MPFNHLVPKELTANLEYRQRVIEYGAESEEGAADLRQMCAKDPLFFLNVFGWTYDSRIVAHPELPFIAYDYQEKALLDLLAGAGLVQGIEPHDVAIEKSRDAGASWLCVVADEWAWQFFTMLSFLWVSRKEEFVDKPDDPKSLFWKFDFFISHLPGFLRPRLLRTHLHALNADTGCTIDGESTTGDVARGDRRTRILLDEFASVGNGQEVLAATADATSCRTFNSTPKGMGTAFYAVVNNPEVRKLRFHWSQHPEKGRGLYGTKDGRVEVLDKAYNFPTDYKFVLDGKVRSPWYDAECRRRVSPLEIAQELDIDYHASGAPYFDAATLTRVRQEDVRPPLLIGELTYDSHAKPIKFVDKRDGSLRLWVNLDAHGHPAVDRLFVMGADTSAGSGASNSCLSIGDVQTGEKVAELATPRLMPHEFAVYAGALGRWFAGTAGEAFAIWEGFGPGDLFGKVLIELGYRNIYYRRDETRLRQKISDRPGWFPTADNKETALGDYRRALASKQFINRSLEAVNEAAEYVFLPDGGVGHASAEHNLDPSGARRQHGDRVVADMLCWKGMKEMAGALPKEDSVAVPQGSFAYRRLQRRAREHAVTYF